MCYYFVVLFLFLLKCRRDGWNSCRVYQEDHLENPNDWNDDNPQSLEFFVWKATADCELPAEEGISCAGLGSALWGNSVQNDEP